jgi:hypothetical protein
VAQTFEQLREENIRLRQQAHYYKSLHEAAVAKLRQAEGIITALKQKVARWSDNGLGAAVRRARSLSVIRTLTTTTSSRLRRSPDLR